MFHWPLFSLVGLSAVVLWRALLLVGGIVVVGSIVVAFHREVQATWRACKEETVDFIVIRTDNQTDWNGKPVTRVDCQMGAQLVHMYFEGSAPAAVQKGAKLRLHLPDGK